MTKESEDGREGPAKWRSVGRFWSFLVDSNEGLGRSARKFGG